MNTGTLESKIIYQDYLRDVLAMTGNLSIKIRMIKASTDCFETKTLDLVFDKIEDALSDIQCLVNKKLTKLGVTTNVELKPHTCDVCSGRGWIVVDMFDDQMRDHCNVCQETGVVWL